MKLSVRMVAPAIAAALVTRGRDASVPLPDGAGQDEVLAAYRRVVEAERAAHGYAP
ncbi:hypothetical protein [Sorangium sp. So ce542]|uniref:hypothetical protein n=1 Tax=Sorangium sp. So ce542 TaxID=3133316 RepID=UPI003F6064F6